MISRQCYDLKNDNDVKIQNLQNTPLNLQKQAMPVIVLPYWTVLND